MRSVLVAVVVLPVLWGAVVAGSARLAPLEVALWGLVMIVAVLVADRYPGPALCAMTVGWAAVFISHREIDSTVGVMVLAPALAVVATMAGRSPRSERADRAVLAGAPVLAAAAAMAVTGGWDAALGAGVGTAVLAIVPWTVGRWLRSHDELVRAGWDRARLWERVAEQAAEEGRRRERDRLAAEMHDLIGHELARVALGIGALEVDPGLDGDRRAAAGRVREGVTAAAERLADVVRMLRADPAAAGPDSVAEVLDGAAVSGVPVTVLAAVEPSDPVIAETARRVLVEALTNVMVHAPGAPVQVSVTEVDAVIVEVVNGPPVGPPTAHPGGAGLAGLAERVRLVGGRMTAGRVRDGWRVTAELPTAPAAPLDTTVHERRATAHVNRSARRAVGATVAVGAVVGTLIAAAMVVDAATSVLDPADFDALVPGTSRSAVAVVLPSRVRTDDPDTGVPDPPGTSCAHYGTHANPFDERRGDLFRLCFAGDRLVDKALLVRTTDGPAMVIR